MKIKKFSELDENLLEKIINKHFNHWSKYSEFMNLEDTRNKFYNLYANNNDIPYGIALMEKDNLIGFCVLKMNCLEKYPQFYPWISDVMIFDEFRKKGYGRKLIEVAKLELKSLGYDKVYLWTDKAPEFYEKLGFKYAQDIIKNNNDGVGRLYFDNLK